MDGFLQKCPRVAAGRLAIPDSRRLIGSSSDRLSVARAIIVGTLFQE